MLIVESYSIKDRNDSKKKYKNYRKKTISNSIIKD